MKKARQGEPRKKKSHVYVLLPAPVRAFSIPVFILGQIRSLPVPSAADYT
jgi:hypothetical protein